MNFDANNTENVPIYDRPKELRNKKLNISKHTIWVPIIEVALIFILFLSGAELSVYSTTKSLSAGIFDRVSDTNSTPYNLYDSKWIFSGVMVMVLMAISVLVLCFRYNRATSLVADILGVITPAVCSLVVMIMALSIFGFSTSEGLSHSGVTYYESASETVGGGGFWICAILLVYIIFTINNYKERLSLSAKLAAGIEEEKPEEEAPKAPDTPEARVAAMPTAADFFARYNTSKVEEESEEGGKEE